MATLKETLELVITANTAGAVKGLENVGNTAEKELGKTEKGAQKLGGQLQVAGAAMVGFGAVALVGLSKAADAAEEARLSSLKLTNSLANSSAITDKSAKAFDDLAGSLQKKTVFDDEAVRSGEALLIQFGLTKDQVLGLTPLVADLAAKMGYDFETASKAVGKAVDGSSTALKKMGVTVDEAAFKSDHFGAVMDALKGKVGGFAEEQGKTFSGQIEILKNQLNELAEGVGVGVVNAFSDMFGVIQGGLGFIDSLSPGFQSAAGEALTFGAAALVLGGAITFIGGSALKSATALGLLAAAEEGAGARSLTLAGKLGLATSAVLGLALAYKTGADNAEEFSVQFDHVLAPAEITTDTLDKLEQATHLVGQSMEDTGRKIAEKSIPSALALADAMDRNGRSSADFRKGIDDARVSLQAQAAQQEEVSAAMEGTTVAEKDATAAAKDYDEAVKGLQDTLKSMTEGVLSSFEAQLSLADAQIATRETIEEYNKALQDGTLSQDALQKQTDKTLKTIIDEAKANEGLYESQVAATGGTVDAATANRKLVEELSKVAGTLDPGSPLRAQLLGYISQLQSVPQNVPTAFHADTAAATRAVQDFTRDLLGIPRNVDVAMRVFGGGGGNFRQMAVGGHLAAREPALVGEHGAELFQPDVAGRIIPLARTAANSNGAGYSPTYNVVVNGSNLTGDEIVAAIKRHERQNGTAWRN